MMNNWWFRVAIHHSAADGTLRFEHPTLAGVQTGGWMQRMKDEGKDILNPVFKEVDGAAPVAKIEKRAEVKMTKDGVTRKITLEELKAHNTHDEPWFVVHGEGGLSRAEQSSPSLRRMLTTPHRSGARSLRRHRLPQGPPRRGRVHHAHGRRGRDGGLHGHSLAAGQEDARRVRRLFPSLILPSLKH